jgi:hydroxymethylpyrimidine/phosphomethylpyrimidine kinase
MRSNPPRRLLVIAGSDSSAGAGLQADLKTAQCFGIYAQTIVTAVTAQDTEGVHLVLAMPADIVRAQIEAALNDIGADAVKIGMLANGAIAVAVANALAETKIPVVLDPVLVSSSGRALLDRAGIEILKSHLLLRAELVTPNLPESEALVGIRPETEPAINQAAEAFSSLGAANVLFKGGHGTGKIVRDVLAGFTPHPWHRLRSLRRACVRLGVGPEPGGGGTARARFRARCNPDRARTGARPRTA